MWMQDDHGLTHLVGSPQAIRRVARKPLAEFRVGRRKQSMRPFEKQLNSMALIAGTPKTGHREIASID